MLRLRCSRGNRKRPRELGTRDPVPGSLSPTSNRGLRTEKHRAGPCRTGVRFPAPPPEIIQRSLRIQAGTSFFLFWYISRETWNQNPVLIFRARWNRRFLAQHFGFFSYAFGRVRSASNPVIMAPTTQMSRMNVTPGPMPLEAPILAACNKQSKGIIEKGEIVFCCHSSNRLFIGVIKFQWHQEFVPLHVDSAPEQNEDSAC